MFGRLLLAGVLAIGCAVAQDDMGGGGGGRGGGGGGGGRGGGGGDMGANLGGGPRKATRVEQAVEKLKLTKEQKEEFAKVFSAAGERSGSVRLELDKARADLAGALIDGKPAEDVAKLTTAYAAVSARMTRVEADAFTKVYAMLKPNQQAKFDQAYDLLSGIFSGATRGNAGGGRGMGRGMGGGRGEGR